MRAAYVARVQRIREEIAAGEVYQVNLCRVLSAPLPGRPDLRPLGAALARGNPAPYAAVVHLPDQDVSIACASPERFLGRDGDVVTSDPIKGTAQTADGLLPKDHAENVMIVDLVRNDLSRVAEVGTVDVPRLCEIEQHPGAGPPRVSRRSATAERGRLGRPARRDVPAGVGDRGRRSPQRCGSSTSSSRCRVASTAVPWAGSTPIAGRPASLSRSARSGRRGARLHFGTGAGITWGSDPAREWEETELKAARLRSRWPHR